MEVHGISLLIGQNLYLSSSRLNHFSHESNYRQGLEQMNNQTMISKLIYRLSGLCSSMNLPQIYIWTDHAKKVWMS